MLVAWYSLHLFESKQNNSFSLLLLGFLLFFSTKECGTCPSSVSIRKTKTAKNADACAVNLDIGHWYPLWLSCSDFVKLYNAKYKVVNASYGFSDQKLSVKELWLILEHVIKTCHQEPVYRGMMELVWPRIKWFKRKHSPHIAYPFLFGICDLSAWPQPIPCFYQRTIPYTGNFTNW